MHPFCIATLSFCLALLCLSQPVPDSESLHALLQLESSMSRAIPSSATFYNFVCRGCYERGPGSRSTSYFCSYKAVATDRQLASLTAQCRQVYCLVEMTPSAPSWRPPHRRGEFDGFPGRRERPNQCRHKTIVSGLFNIAKPQKKSQKKNSTI